MKKGIWIILVMLLLAGCGEKGPVTLDDDTTVSTMLDDLSIRLYIENNTDKPIMAQFEVDIHNAWLSSQIEGERKVNNIYRGNFELNDDEFRLDYRSENLYTISYELKQKVKKLDLIEAVDQGAVEITILSEDGEVLTNQTIQNIHIFDIGSNNTHNGFALLLFTILTFGLGGYFLDKFIRNWTGIPKMDKEDIPKSYKIINGVAHFVSSVFLTFFLFNNIAPGDFWFYVIVLVFISFLFQVLLDFIFFKNSKEYRVTLINFIIILLIITVISNQYPYPQLLF